MKCSSLGIKESTPQTQSNVSWISSKAELEISFLKSDIQISEKLSENGSCYRNHTCCFFVASNKYEDSQKVCAKKKNPGICDMKK